MVSRYDSINLELPKYKPKYVAVEAKTGSVFQGRKGRYQVMSIGRDTINVEYIDGEWKGKKVTMSKVTHNAMQQRLPMQSKILVDSKLDLWWDKFPSLYHGEWYENIESGELLGKLELKYPQPADIITKALEIARLGE